MDFNTLGLSEPVLKAVADAGYLQPTPIQAQAIPIVLQGRDVLGTAQTGTGKTAGFTLPLIDILSGGRARARMPRALILEPTRELADQVAHSFEIYGKYSNLTMALLIGGVTYADQERLLDRGVDVLIATPGRLMDHFERGRVMLTGVQVFVIDEADRMLDMGFMPDVERIGKMLPPLRQTLFFSATMPPEMRRLADNFLSNPKEIAVARQSTTAEKVTQFLVPVSQKLKRDMLRALIRSEGVKNAIIFCNRKRDVDILAKSLIRHGFDAQPLHGDMDQSVRTATLEKFKRNEISLLVASDVAARGLDVQGLTHVFNFDVPTHPEDYVHRIGRTGRAGLEGRAFTMVTEDDAKYIRAITSLINREIPTFSLPGFEPGEFSGSTELAAAGTGDESAPARGRARRERGGRGRSERSSGDRSASERSGSERSGGERSGGERSGRDRNRAPKRPARDPELAPESRSAEALPAAQPAAPIAEARPPRPRSTPQSRPQRDSGPGEVGMGDHMPDFLKRPVRKANP